MRILQGSKLYLLFFIFSLTLNGQEITSKTIELDVSNTVHGSGDLGGLSFSSNYVFKKNKYSQLIFIEGTIHDGENLLIFDAPDGRTVDGSIRSTTAGVQVGYGIRYDVLRFNKQYTSIGLSSFLRYQSSSLYDVVSIYYPQLTEFPIPLIAFEHLESARTYAVGLKLIVSHTIKLTRALDLRLHGNFQFDSNEDSIRGYGIGIAKTW
jgi:hypothetical protein